VPPRGNPLKGITPYKFLMPREANLPEHVPILAHHLPLKLACAARNSSVKKNVSLDRSVLLIIVTMKVRLLHSLSLLILSFDRAIAIAIAQHVSRKRKTERDESRFDI